MKRAATGRILFWRGTSLWIGHAGEPADFHAHHAVQVALPFRGGRAAFRRPSGEWMRYEAAVIDADVVHAFEARSQFMAQIFVEPESVQGRAIARRHATQGIAPLPVELLAAPVEALASAFEQRAPDAELISLAERAIAALTGVVFRSGPIDARITRALRYVRDHLESPLSLAEVAATVNLSPERFRHLFAAETGIGLRPYVLWLRLEHAFAAHVRGSSLTEAAIAGGFADSPHFSRTFRRMFGIAPASVSAE